MAFGVQISGSPPFILHSMSTKDKFSQCVLKRKKNGNTLTMVSWIESHHKKGTRVEDDEGNIWTVAARGNNILPEDVVIENSRAYTRHRIATDI